MKKLYILFLTKHITDLQLASYIGGLVVRINQWNNVDIVHGMPDYESFTKLSNYSTEISGRGHPMLF